MADRLPDESRVADWVVFARPDWAQTELGRLCHPVRTPNVGMKEKQVLSLSYGRVVVKPAEKMRGLLPASFETYQVLRPGDIVVRPTDLQNDQNSLRVGQANDDGIITSAYISLRPTSGVSDRYLFQLLRSYDFMKVFYGFGSGLRQNLDFKHIRRIPAALPGHVEQQLIVRYIDNAEVRIARAIQAQERLLDLLVEQRLAVFDATLARHATSSASTEGPGWFGDIPSTWREKRLRAVLAESNRRSPAGAEPHYSMSQRLGLVPAGIGGGVLLSTDYTGGRVCEPGDIVLNRLKAHLGVFAVAPALCVISPDYTVLRVTDGSLPDFICAVLRSRMFRPQLRISVRGLVEGFWRLYTPDLLRLALPVPPIDVQKTIMAEVDTQWARIDSAMEATQETIALLREYRTRLISDVVTGKKDVRAEASSLEDVDPDELAAVLADSSAVGDEELGDDDAD